jgi:uncharacterized membrane protein
MSIIMAWQHMSSEAVVKGAVGGTDGDMLWDGSERMGTLGLRVRKVKALTDGTDGDMLWDGSEWMGTLGLRVRKVKALTEDGDSNRDW